MWTQTNSTVGLSVMVVLVSGHGVPVTGVGQDDRSAGSGSSSDQQRGERAADELGEHEHGTEAGVMPAKVSENMRAMVTAGLAKLVEDVNQ